MTDKEVCPCGFKNECGAWCGNGHTNGMCPIHKSVIVNNAKYIKLQQLLAPIITWYKKVEEEGEPDGSYLYDVTVDKFEYLSRGDYCQIIELLK